MGRVRQRLKGSFPVVAKPEGHERRGKSLKGSRGRWLPVLRLQGGHLHPSRLICGSAPPNVCRAVRFPVPLPDLSCGSACRNQEHWAETKPPLCCFSTEEGKTEPPSCQDVLGCVGENIAAALHDCTCVQFWDHLYMDASRNFFQPPNPCITFF